MAEICNLCSRGYNVNSYYTPSNVYSAATTNKVSLITVTAGNIFIQLPETPIEQNKMFTFKVLDPTATGNSATIVPPAGHTINNTATLLLTGNNRMVTIVKDERTYFIITDSNGGTGDGVIGSGSSTDRAAARWNGTTGLIIQNSGVVIDDSNNTSGGADWTSESLLMGGVRSLGTSTTDNLLIGQYLSTPTGSRDLIMGYNSGVNLTSGSDHILIGNNISNSVTFTDNTICIGNTAIADGNQSISIGELSASAGTGNIIINNLMNHSMNGVDNVSFGNQDAGDYNVGNNNVNYGAYVYSSRGNSNVAFGGYYSDTGTGSYNTLMGISTAIMNGDNNVYIGAYGTSGGGSSSSNNTAIQNIDAQYGGGNITYVGRHNDTPPMMNSETTLIGGPSALSQIIGYQNTVIGTENVCEANYSSIIGFFNIVSDIPASYGHYSTSIGSNNTSVNNNTIMIGSNCNLGSYKDYIIAIGNETDSSILTETIQIGINDPFPPAYTHVRFHQLPQFSSPGDAAMNGINSGNLYVNTSEFSTYVLCVV